MADFFFLAVLLLWSRFCGVSTHSLDGSGEIDFTTSLPASTLNFSSIPSPKRIHKGSGLGRSRNGSAPVPPPPPLWFEDEKCSRPAPSGCSPIGDQTCFGLKLSNSQVEAANRG